MKVQLQAQTLRFRIDEDELAALLDGAEVLNRTTLPGGAVFVQRLVLAGQDPATLACTPALWQLRLPLAQVQAYATRLPCRDGLEFQLDPLRLSFEVDVRDSVRWRRGAG